jgi:hypothetical protein
MQSRGVPGWVKHQIAKFLVSMSGLSCPDHSAESLVLGARFQAFAGIVFNHEEHEVQEEEI